MSERNKNKLMINITSSEMKSALDQAGSDETVRVIRYHWRWEIQASMIVQATTFNPVTGDLITFRKCQYKVK